MIPLSNEQPPPRLVAAIHSAVRAVVGVLFACHGAAGLFGVLGGIGPGGTFAFGYWPGWWAALLALIGGSMVAIGLCTRMTSVACSAMMAYVYVTVHLPHALLPTASGGETAALFSLIFLLIASIGAGSYAVDTVIRQRRRASDIRRYLDTGDVVGISISD